MLNLKDDNRKTIFIDIDGVIVPHNYDPENIPDSLIKETLEYLRANNNAYIILTTSRSKDHAECIKRMLAKCGIVIHEVISDLPTGQRIIINDMKKMSDEPKAIAINVLRNKGILDERSFEFCKEWCS